MRKFSNQEEAIQEADKFIDKFAKNVSLEKCVERVYNSKWGWDFEKSQATATAVAAILMKKKEALLNAPVGKKGKIIRNMETVFDFFDEFAKVSESSSGIFVDFPSLDKYSKNFDKDYARAWSYMMKTFKKECSKEYGKLKRENGETLGANVKDFLSNVIDFVGETIGEAINHTPQEETPEEKQDREDALDYLNKIL